MTVEKQTYHQGPVPGAVLNPAGVDVTNVVATIHGSLTPERIYPYQTQGYPAARFTEPNETFAHEHQDVRVENGVQFGDHVEFVDFNYVARVAKVNAATLWSLSQAPGTPNNVQIHAPVLTNDTLTWDANTDPDLDQYEVVWRQTSEEDWTNAIPVGNVTSISLPAAPKDNFQFGVRAVHREGHRSPVGFPVTNFTN
jgi:hypothetical protein